MYFKNKINFFFLFIKFGQKLKIIIQHIIILIFRGGSRLHGPPSVNPPLTIIIISVI